jgi:hypothetical protein
LGDVFHHKEGRVTYVDSDDDLRDLPAYDNGTRSLVLASGAQVAERLPLGREIGCVWQ